MSVFVFISSFVSIRVRNYVQHFFDAVGNKISDKIISREYALN